MNNIRLIMTREFMTRVRKKSFPVTIIITILVLLLIVYLPTIIGFFAGGSQTKLAVINQTNQTAFATVDLKTFLDTSLNTRFDKNGLPKAPDPKQKPPFVISYPASSELEATRQQVLDGKLDALLVIARNGGGELSFTYLTGRGTNDSSTQLINSAATRLAISDRLARLGITQPQQAANVLSPASFKSTSVQEVKDTQKGVATNEFEAAGNYGLVFLMVIALFTSISAYGSIIAQGVAEEKGNRIMEIMITAARPFDLLFGKVLGIGLLGILQFVIVYAVAIPAILLQPTVSEALLGDAGATSMSLAGVNMAMLGYFAIFYLLGFFLYATLYAAVGSLCSRTEDVQQALAPLTTILMIAYFIAIFGLQAIDAPWVVVCSYIPFFSPILMLARIGLGTVSPVEIVITIALLAATMVLCAWIAARIYRVGVLLYGKRPSFVQALGLARATK